MTQAQFMEMVRLMRHYQRADVERPSTTNWLRKKQLEKEVDDAIERYKEAYMKMQPKQMTLEGLFPDSPPPLDK